MRRFPSSFEEGSFRLLGPSFARATKRGLRPRTGRRDGCAPRSSKHLTYLTEPDRTGLQLGQIQFQACRVRGDDLPLSLTLHPHVCRPVPAIHVNAVSFDLNHEPIAGNSEVAV